MHLLAALAALVLTLTGVGLTGLAGTAPEPVAAPPDAATLISTALPTIVPSPTPTLPDTPTPFPAATLTNEPTPTHTATPTDRPTSTPHPGIALYPPNEQGEILVLVYHVIGRPEDRWQRTPENLRADLEYLVTHGYYPVNLIDVASGDLGHVPRGRRPIVLTFDDSTAGHFRYLSDGTIDPDCAVGILLAMHEEYKDDWPLRATFFVQLNDADEPGAPLFRQPELAVQKLQALVDWGFEVGSHTIHHPVLSDVDEETVRWELAVSQSRIEALLPGYEVRSLALPHGAYPTDRALVEQGYSESAKLDYRYEAVVRLGAEACPSPASAAFDPYAIPRVQAIQAQLDWRFAYYEAHPGQYYVSDGE